MQWRMVYKFYKISLILTVNFEVYTFPNSSEVFLCMVQFKTWCNAKSYVAIRAEIPRFFSDSLSVLISFRTAHCALSGRYHFFICGSNYFQKMSLCQSQRIRLRTWSNHVGNLFPNDIFRLCGQRDQVYILVACFFLRFYGRRHMSSMI